MLIYLATYPRSGNSLLQRILKDSFGLSCSQVKVAADPLGGIPNALPKFISREDLSRTREELAASPRIHLVKLHDRPFENLHPGERVIQTVRHPGASLWSYFRYECQAVLSKRGRRVFDNPAPTLDNIIEGDVNVGSWSDYQRAWDAFRLAHNTQCLLLQYEDVVADRRSAVTELSGFLRISIVSERTDSSDFSQFRTRFPGWGLRGTSEGYEAFYSAAQLKRLWLLHGPCAEQHGYSPPALERAAAGDQVEWLQQLVEFAWERAARKRLRGADTP